MFSVFDISHVIIEFAFPLLSLNCIIIWFITSLQIVMISKPMLSISKIIGLIIVLWIVRRLHGKPSNATNNTERVCCYGSLDHNTRHFDLLQKSFLYQKEQ